MKQKMLSIASVLLLVFGFAANGLGQWVRLGKGIPPGTQTINSFVLMGNNLFAATVGGVLMSSDSGTNWQARGLSPKIVHVLKTYGSYLFAGTDDGLFLSTDTGLHWVSADSGITYKNILSLAVIGNKLLAGNDGGGGAFLSTNNGKSWVLTNSGIWPGTHIYSFIVKDKNIYADSHSTIFLSTNEGISWVSVPIDSDNNNIHTILLLGVTDTNLFVTTNLLGMLSTSIDGKSWRSIADINVVAGSNSFLQVGTNLFAGDFNLFLSTDGGKTWVIVNADGSYFHSCTSLLVIGQYLVAGDDNGGIWHRPLSEMIGSSAVINKKIKSSISSFPNPISSKTTVSFSNEQREFVSVNIVNVLGKECASLFSGELDAGSHSYEWDASRLPPGMYLCLLRENGIAREIPMMVMR